jgi:hypothetical protein
MSEKTKVTLTNAEAVSKNISLALGMLAAKPFGFKLCWNITDVEGAIRMQSNKYNDALKMLYKQHGATGNDRIGYKFDEKDNPVPDACIEDIALLNEQTMDHEMELIELPEKIKDKSGKEVEAHYEPLITITLRKFIKRA